MFFFFLKAVLIIAFSRLIDFLFRLAKLRQPRVIAEVIGGIILGPSAFGKIPKFTEIFFPASSLPALYAAANFGLVFFLFLVGLELDPRTLRRNFKRSVSISLSGIILPFGCGAAVAWAIYSKYADQSKPFSSFVIFMGTAIAITAFPVLARILTELKLLGTYVGQTTISAAAVDDTMAWCLLALVISLIHASSGLNALWVFLALIAYALFLIFAFRPILLYMINRTCRGDHISETMVFATLLAVAFSGWITQILGVHAIFGGFMIGVIIPHESGFAIKLTQKLEDIITIVFLPLYFAYSGLNTRIDELNNGTIWGYITLIVVVTCFGKVIGCSIAAKISGHTNREALTIGFLMNCKGLVELIVLNVGLSAGVINTTIFTMMVVMALVTTCMTTPIVTWLYPKKYYKYIVARSETGGDGIGGREPSIQSLSLQHISEKATAPLSIMVTLPSMQAVPAMMSLVQLLTSDHRPMKLHALRLIEMNDRASTFMMAADSTETMNADPVMNVFRTFGQLSRVGVNTILAVTDFDNFSDHIISNAKDVGANFVIIPYLPQNNIKPSKRFLYDDVLIHAPCSVGIFIDRGFGVSTETDVTDPRVTLPGQNQHIVLPFFGGADDREAILFVLALAKQSGVSIKIIQFKTITSSSSSDDKTTTTTTDATTVSIANPPEPVASNMTPASSYGDLESAHQLVDRTSTDIKKEQIENSADDALIDIVIRTPGVTFEQRTPASKPDMTAVQSMILSLGKKDLIVLGRSFYMSLPESMKDSLDRDCVASIMLVQKHDLGLN